MESSGYADRLVAFPTSTEWRYGPRGHVYRSTDALQWTDVSGAGYNEDGPWIFAAISDRQAMFVARSTVDDQLTVEVTTDGGGHWQSYPLRLP